MRLQPKHAIAGIALAGVGLATVMSLPSLAADPPLRMYFHSGTGDYAGDADADPGASIGGRAPAGATLDTHIPIHPDSATGTSLDVFGVPGSRLAPTFLLPETGTITNMCVDIWASSTTAADELTANLYIQTGNTVESNLPVVASFDSFSDLTVPYPESGAIVRMTGIVKTEAPYALAPNTTLSFTVGFPGDDFTLHYDSTVNYSSVTLNPRSCTPGPLPEEGEEPPTEAPTSSAPSEEPSEAPSEEPSEEPSEAPTVAPTVAPPALRDSEVAYTGPSSVRYGDTVTLSATVADEAGVPANGGTVSFDLSGTRYTAPVGSNGKAQISARVNAAPETYILETRYSGANGLRPSAVQDGMTVTRAVSVCSLQRGSSSTNSTLIGVLSRPDTARIANAPVTFLHQNRSVGTVRTDSRGVARTETAPKGRAGDTFSVTFAGDKFYAGCRKDLKI